MVRHWTGEFKGLDEGNGNYQLAPDDWKTIGRLTAQATKTIPSAFVSTIPNVATDLKLFKAEVSAFWIQYLAPILLLNRLPEPYYSHMLLIREIIMRSLQLKITRAEVDELEDMINRWVAEYEQYYYQYASYRLPACPLTIHALLHIPHYIRMTGPPWTSWAFVMERFCGHILPAVKNHVHPYEHLDNFVQRRAQMQIVLRVHNLPALARLLVNYRYENGVEISSCETMYPEFPDIVLGAPVNSRIPFTAPLPNQFSRYFGVFHEGQSAANLHVRFDRNSLIRYGRMRMTDSNNMRTASVVDSNPIAHDNSYIKFDLLPDANASYRYEDDVPFWEAQYGRLLDIFHLVFIKDDGSRNRYLLARVQPCETGSLDATLPEHPVVKFNMTESMQGSSIIIHIDTIVATVGRVHLDSPWWAIVDRSRGCMCAQFVDEDGNVEHDM
ncbi:hypothetical protein FS749_005958 [Ceratobasidium sp. UAMH 11750]|nr:hypothetical protein FS749_005958 [Ceratobasidium sp. UAMH 11750]